MTTITEIAMASLGLTEKELRAILERAETRAFPKGVVVVKEGERNESLYLIVEGRVQAFIIDQAGKEAVLSTKGTGEFFGSTGFNNEPHPGSIRTVEPSRVIVLPKSDFRIFYPRDNLFSLRASEELVHQIEQQAQELSEALQQKTAISEVLRVISNSPTNAQSVLDTVAENAARLCDVTDAEILQVEGNELRLVAKYGQSRMWPIGTLRPLNRNWVSGRAVLDRSPIQVYDIQAAKAEFPLGVDFAKEGGHRTTFATPLLREGVAIGAILIRRLEVQRNMSMKMRHPVTEIRLQYFLSEAG